MQSGCAKILATMRQAISQPDGLGCAGGGCSRQFLVQQVHHVERYPTPTWKPCAKTRLWTALTGKLQWQADADMTDAAELDRTVSPSEMALPVSSDSSQLEAVRCRQRREFHSARTSRHRQITDHHQHHCQCPLYQGKRVLFAAEKDGGTLGGAKSSGQNRTGALVWNVTPTRPVKSDDAVPTEGSFGRDKDKDSR